MDLLSAWWPDAHFKSDLMARLARGAHSVLGFEIVRVPFDQTIEAELTGADVDFGDSTANCSVRSHPVKLDGRLPNMPDLGFGRARVVVEAISILKEQLKEEAAVVGGIVGPFTLISQLTGVSSLLMQALRRPEAIQPYLEFGVQLGAEYARRQIAAGADAICVEDMGASLDLTSPSMYRDLILPSQQRLIASIGAPTILHICGSNTRILDLIAMAGAAAVSLESRTDLARAVGSLRSAVMGGVAPVEALLNGSLDDVRNACLTSLAAGVHILAPGCGLAAATPTENLQEMVRVAREWQP
jgi:[methyl-Co(III) methanol-specific corrinoid protein]:coenzyme M methyltransferase